MKDNEKLIKQNIDYDNEIKVKSNSNLNLEQNNKEL